MQSLVWVTLLVGSGLSIGMVVWVLVDHGTTRPSVDGDGALAAADIPDCGWCDEAANEWCGARFGEGFVPAAQLNALNVSLALRCLPMAHRHQPCRWDAECVDSLRCHQDRRCDGALRSDDSIDWDTYVFVITAITSLILNIGLGIYELRKLWQNRRSKQRTRPLRVKSRR